MIRIGVAGFCENRKTDYPNDGNNHQAFGCYHPQKHLSTQAGYYMHYICVHLKKEFPKQLSYNRFVAVKHRVFVPMMFFLNTVCFGKCTGITFIDSTPIRVCHNKRIKRNKVFSDIAKVGKNATGWFYGFKLHLICNDKGELLSFCLTLGNADDRNRQILKPLTKKLFGDRKYISSSLFKILFNNGIHLVTGIKSNMKNRLTPFDERIRLQKRSIIEMINDELKNICEVEHPSSCYV